MKPPIPGPVPGTRIDNDEWPLAFVYIGAFGGAMRTRTIVNRSPQLSPIHDEFAAELQDVRRNLGGMLFVAVAALLKDIQK